MACAVTQDMIHNWKQTSECRRYTVKTYASAVTSFTHLYTYTSWNSVGHDLDL